MPYAFGWKPSLPDHRDLKYAAPRHISIALPSRVDLRDQMPAVYDQGNLGSCTGHGTAAILHFLEMKQKKPAIFTPARLAIYYCTRILEGTVFEDSGASIRNAIKAIARWGFCDENLYPYDISKFKDKIPSSVYGAMWHERINQYLSVNQDESDIKSVLASGNLVTFGFTVYSSFISNEVAATGIMPMPQINERIQGGHCVTLVGFNDDTRMFITRNSWGEGWGQKGYFMMPYDFLLNRDFCDDFWTIQQIP